MHLALQTPNGMLSGLDCYVRISNGLFPNHFVFRRGDGLWLILYVPCGPQMYAFQNIGSKVTNTSVEILSLTPILRCVLRNKT